MPAFCGELRFFFFRDDAINSDKEYHAQMVKIPMETAGSSRFNIAYQYGKRGSHLTTGYVYETPLASWRNAYSEYDKLLESKRKKGYRPIEMESLNAVYQRMSALVLDGSGVDLFMSARANVISLADYFRKNQATSKVGEFAFVDSYNASRAISTMLAEAGMGTASQDEAKMAKMSAGIAEISQMLRSTSLSRINIFLGRQTGDTVEPCFEADRRMLMEKPVKASAKKKSPKP